MNSLEQFNLFYQGQEVPSYETSLKDFFESEVRGRIPGGPLVILDLGAGTKSLFEDIELPFAQITAIDFSPVAVSKARAHSQVNYQLRDLTQPTSLEKEKFSLIFDSHCLHCITGEEKRKEALRNVHEALKDGQSLFCAEMMVKGKSESSVILPFKHVPSARDLEEEILTAGFKIIYFMIVRNLIFSNEHGDCDLLRVIARK